MTYEKIKTVEEAVILSEIAADAGALMLASGAEIYRVEDTVERIIRSKESIKDVDVYSAFNVIFISFSYKGEIHSNVRRVKSRSNNLYFVDKVNTFSRAFAAGNFTLDEAMIELQKIKQDDGYPKYLNLLGATLAAGAYSLLLGAGLAEVLTSFAIGFIGFAVSLYVDRLSINYFVVNFLYGMLISGLTLLINSFTPLSINVVIISGMMAFVPGMLITNAVRDLMSGDPTSGMTGLAMAIFISTALAIGVALPIGIFSAGGLI